MKNAKRPPLTEPPPQTPSTSFTLYAVVCIAALYFCLLYCTIAPMSLSNFDRFFSLLSPAQQSAMDAICSALREDPTCLDTHRAGFVPSTDLPSGDDGKETSDDL